MQLTQEAKIATDFHFIRAIFAVVGFVIALKRALADALQSDEKACKQGNFASGKIFRQGVFADL